MSIFSNSISTLRLLRIERSDGFVSSLVDLKDTFCSILTLLFSARILFGLGFNSMLLTTISDCFFLRCWKRFNFLATAFQGKSHGVNGTKKSFHGVADVFGEHGGIRISVSSLVGEIWHSKECQSCSSISFAPMLVSIKQAADES